MLRSVYHRPKKKKNTMSPVLFRCLAPLTTLLRLLRATLLDMRLRARATATSRMCGISLTSSQR